MRVPIRKPDKYLRPKADPFLTKEKFNELAKEAEKLKKIVRPRLAEEVKRLAAMGDFSENAAYQIAKGRLRGINQRILDLDDLLGRAEIIKPQTGKGKVQLGCRVTVAAGEKEKTFLILGSAETNPSSGVISANSPLGAALVGKKAGDTVKVKTANKEIEYKIIKIN